MSNEITTYAKSPSFVDMRLDRQTYPRLESVTRDQAIGNLAKIVTQAALYRGQDMKPETIEFISVSLYDEMMADTQYKLRTISFAEIQKVVKTAVLGGAEMFGVSVASLYKIIVDYAKGEGHRAALEVIKMKEEERQNSIKQSIIAPILNACAGALVKHSKQ